MGNTKNRHFVNRSTVKGFVFDYAASIGRGDVITQVSAEVYADLEGAVKKRLAAMVQRHPSAFRTLKP